MAFKTFKNLQKIRKNDYYTHADLCADSATHSALSHTDRMTKEAANKLEKTKEVLLAVFYISAIFYPKNPHFNIFLIINNIYTIASTIKVIIDIIFLIN